MRVRVLLTILAICLFVLPLGLASKAAGSRGGAKEAGEEKYLAQVLELTNRERTTRGLRPLKPQANLAAAARWLAQDMASGDYIDHRDSKDRNIDKRLPAFGYTDYRMMGENVAGGQPTPEAVVAAWMRSPGHRANILNPDFQEIGIACVVAPRSRYRCYWVQDFGVRLGGAEGTAAKFRVPEQDLAAQVLWADLVRIFCWK